MQKQMAAEVPGVIRNQLLMFYDIFTFQIRIEYEPIDLLSPMSKILEVNHLFMSINSKLKKDRFIDEKDTLIE